ncbi:hypothetical protein [Sporosarcina cyprini]|uniref:YqgU-like beta propeller domain-containing protein n=1 Tax=Sporosarcina cyprini TaxID=2910523 RepID=UPI001EDEA9A0|nr:hypothetical protein [Sporosarcina cyprini]MCG3089066.1 hypothetical protein [Sporosarcina cyprini]
MIKKFIPLIILGIVLTGCTSKEVPPDVQTYPETELPNETGQSAKDTLQTLHVQPEHFQYVVDWLSDTEIVYVEQEENTYAIKSFNRLTGKSELIDREDSFINDVLVHPSKKYLLIHTSDDSDSATVKIISLDGTVLHQLAIESKELSVEWNDIDENLVLLTAFHDDWSFDLFYYDGHEEEMSSLSLEDPFPKWLGTEQLLTLSENGAVSAYDVKTDETSPTGISGVVQFETYFDSLLTMQPGEGEKVLLEMRNGEGKLMGKVEMPAVSSFSGLVMPEMDWLSADEVRMKVPTAGGKLDEMTAPFQLADIRGGQVNVLMDDVPDGPLHCSPAGTYCLTGYEGEDVLDLAKKELNKWLEQ